MCIRDRYYYFPINNTGKANVLERKYYRRKKENEVNINQLEKNKYDKVCVLVLLIHETAANFVSFTLNQSLWRNVNTVYDFLVTRSITPLRHKLHTTLAVEMKAFLCKLFILLSMHTQSKKLKILLVRVITIALYLCRK